MEAFSTVIPPPPAHSHFFLAHLHLITEFSANEKISDFHFRDCDMHLKKKLTILLTMQLSVYREKSVFAHKMV